MSLRTIILSLFLLGVGGVVFWTNRLVNQEADTLSNLSQPLAGEQETVVIATSQSVGQLPVIDPQNDPLAPVINPPPPSESPKASQEPSPATYEFPISGPLVQ